MAGVDLEAATLGINKIKTPISDDDDDIPAVQSTVSGQLPDPRRSQDAQLYSMTKAIIGKILLSLPGLLQQQLEDTSDAYELTDVASNEDDTEAGAQEDVNGQSSSRFDINNRRDRNQIATSQLAHESSLKGAWQTLLDETSLNKTAASPKASPIQQAASNTASTSGYKQIVQVMDEKDLEIQNMCRNAVRQRWRGSSTLQDIEDPWKALLRRTDTVAERLFNDAWCSDEQRKNLQLELSDALSFAAKDTRLDSFATGGFRAISCWISLMGVRLCKIYSSMPYASWKPSDKYTESSSPFKQAQVLVECIWACNVSRSAKVADVLKSCYERRIFRQPDFGTGSEPKSSVLNIRAQIRAVRIAVYLVNILYRHDESLLYTVGDLVEAWEMPISVVEESLRQSPPNPANDGDEGCYFSVRDLNLKNLERVGKLEIRWTTYWDEHLELERDESANILKLYWFSPSLSKCLRRT